MSFVSGGGGGCLSRAIAGADGVKPDPDHMVRLANWPRPINVTEVQSFVGLASYFHRFVKSFADVAAPLTDLTKRGRSVGGSRNVKQLLMI